MRYFKIGQTWVLAWPRFGYHLGSAYWWKPLLLFPCAVFERTLIYFQ